MPRRGEASAARELYATALESAPDARSRAEALEGLGHAAYRSGRPRDAAEFLEEALGFLDGAAWERPDLAETLGRAYADLGELERATVIFERCRRHFHERGDREQEIRFGCLVGYALTDRGMFAEAERALADAVAAGEGIDDPLVRARLCWAQARLRGEQGLSEMAAEHARAALEILRPTEHKHFLAQTYELLASLSIDLGHAEEALSLLRAGWPLLIVNATPLEVAHYRIEEARALAASGEREGASAVAMRVVAQLDGTHPSDMGRAYVLLGEIFDKLGDVVQARHFYEVGITLLEGLGPSRYLAAAYRRLGELFEAEYRSEDALVVIRRALEVELRVRPRVDTSATAA
jgi:tetratricopeptide (TPR) repeat protein